MKSTTLLFAVAAAILAKAEENCGEDGKMARDVMQAQAQGAQEYSKVPIDGGHNTVTVSVSVPQPSVQQPSQPHQAQAQSTDPAQHQKSDQDNNKTVDASAAAAATSNAPAASESLAEVSQEPNSSGAAAPSAAEDKKAKEGDSKKDSEKDGKKHVQKDAKQADKQEHKQEAMQAAKNGAYKDQDESKEKTGEAKDAKSDGKTTGSENAGKKANAAQKVEAKSTITGHAPPAKTAASKQAMMAAPPFANGTIHEVNGTALFNASMHAVNMTALLNATMHAINSSAPLNNTKLRFNNGSLVVNNTRVSVNDSKNIISGNHTAPGNITHVLHQVKPTATGCSNHDDHSHAALLRALNMSSPTFGNSSAVPAMLQSNTTLLNSTTTTNSTANNSTSKHPGFFNSTLDMDMDFGDDFPFNRSAVAMPSATHAQQKVKVASSVEETTTTVWVTDTVTKTGPAKHLKEYILETPTSTAYAERTVFATDPVEEKPKTMLGEPQFFTDDGVDSQVLETSSAYKPHSTERKDANGNNKFPFFAMVTKGGDDDDSKEKRKPVQTGDAQPDTTVKTLHQPKETTNEKEEEKHLDVEHVMATDIGLGGFENANKYYPTNLVTAQQQPSQPPIQYMTR